MIYIKKQKHGLNAQTDTALLDPIYNGIIFLVRLYDISFPFYNVFIVCDNMWQRTLFNYLYFVFYRNDTTYNLILFDWFLYMSVSCLFSVRLTIYLTTLFWPYFDFLYIYFFLIFDFRHILLL